MRNYEQLRRDYLAVNPLERLELLHEVKEVPEDEFRAVKVTGPEDCKDVEVKVVKKGGLGISYEVIKH